MISAKLSILISSIHSRTEMLNRLLARLHQARCEEIEVLVSIDSGHKPRGIKRNQLVARATGDYIVHIDDDDLVSETYVSLVLKVIDESAPDAILIRGERTDVDGVERPLVFDYKLLNIEQMYDEHNVLWRNPGHLCPIRASIVRAVSFPITEPEDLRWLEWVRPLIRTTARAGEPGEILYHYLWSSKKRDRWQT